jgi:uncharacterized membrane protein (DUF373 family)
MEIKSKPNLFDKSIYTLNGLIIKLLIVILIACLIFASFDLVGTVYNRITESSFLSLNITALFEIFTMVLIIGIGLQLVKSFIKSVSSNVIPVLPILQISIIAVANKIITIDIKTVESYILYGLAALLVGLGIAFYLLKNYTIRDDD